MFGKGYVGKLIDRSAENPADRRRFLKTASATGLVGAGLLASMEAPAASASTDDSNAISDSAILNFALNLEYLEAEFYSNAVYGYGLPSSLTYGRGDRGPVEGGREVPFKSSALRQLAKEIARDKDEHVAFLRGALGGAAVPRPEINISTSFAASGLAFSRTPGQVLNVVYLYPQGRQLGRLLPARRQRSAPHQQLTGNTELHGRPGPAALPRPGRTAARPVRIRDGPGRSCRPPGGTEQVIAS